MKKSKVKFGYEIPTGNEININLAHTVITGLTQEAGKTTAIMGLIKRSGLKALIIKTKIGEKAVTEGSIIPPFYRDNFDWEYAVELLESSRKEKLKFERSWIIKYSKTANTLLEFKNNIDNALSKEKIRDLDKNVLITLQAYLEKILPELQYAPLSKTLDLRDGINIMDLERFKEETQTLVIRSVLNEVLLKEKNTIIIIPEAWRYLPEKVNSPVKRPAESFIRQGATNNNFLWLDSQDITGVSKVILKQVSNWILGYQREKNEIERTLDQLPLPKKSKPKSEEIATLHLGEFYVATSNFTVKAYAQPSWLEDSVAKKIALGKVMVEDIDQPIYIAPHQIIHTKNKSLDYEKQTTIPALFDTNKKINELRVDFISNRNDFFNKFEQINDSIRNIQTELFSIKQHAPIINEDEIVMRVLQKIPINNPNNSVMDKELIIKEVISRIPKSGNVIYEVAPLEKIKKDFLEEAKNKIITDIMILSNNSKKLLRYLETRKVGCSVNEISMKCFLYPSGTGGYSKIVNDAVKELSTILVGYKHNNGKCHGRLKERIKDLLGVHEASEQEIEQVYNHILMNLLGGKNE